MHSTNATSGPLLNFLKSIEDFNSLLCDQNQRTPLSIQAAFAVVQTNYDAVCEADDTWKYGVVEIKCGFEALNQTVQEALAKTRGSASSLIPIPRSGPFNPWLPSLTHCRTLMGVVRAISSQTIDQPKPSADLLEKEVAATLELKKTSETPIITSQTIDQPKPPADAPKEKPEVSEPKETSEISITVDLPNEAFLKSWQDLHESVNFFKSTLDDRSRTNINVQAGLNLIQANYKAVFESDISSNYDVVETKTTFDALNQAIQEVLKKTGRPSSSLVPITRQGPFNPWLPSNSLCQRLIDLTASAPQKKANLPKPPATDKDAEPAVTYPPIELDPCTIS